VIEETFRLFASRCVVDTRSELRILDPAIGTGTFLKISGNLASQYLCRSIHLTGIDIEPRALKESSANLTFPDELSNRIHLTLVNEDFTKWIWPTSGEKFDLIVGNPPWGLLRGDQSGSSRFKDIALDFTSRSLTFLRDDGSLGFLLPGTWLCSSTYENFRDLLLGQGRDIEIIRLHGRWFIGAAYTSDPVALVLGPRLANGKPNLTVCALYESSMEPFRIYSVPVSSVRNYRGRRIPIAPDSFHRFLRIIDTEGAEIKSAREWGVKSFAGLKSYRNREFVFSYEKAESMVANGDAVFKWPLKKEEMSSGVGSKKVVLVPLGKGGGTHDSKGLTDFATSRPFRIRWDAEAIHYYLSKSGLRNSGLYFKDGINFSASGQYCPVFRRSMLSVFDADYPFIPYEETDLWSFLALLNSPVCLFLAKHLVNSSAHFKNEDFADLPIPNPHGLDPELGQWGDRFYKARLAGEQVPDSWYSSLCDAVAKVYGLSDAEKSVVWRWFVKSRLLLGSSAE
jgi:hypothetical protein